MRILFVCLGNICRSPSAEGILRKLADEQNIPLHIESAGLGDWHAGKLPDPRTRDAAARRGYTLTSRAQMIAPHHLDTFDYILAADNRVLHALLKGASFEQKDKIALITHFSPTYKDQEIPDPFYGTDADFEHVLDMLEDACEGLLNIVVGR